MNTIARLPVARTAPAPTKRPSAPARLALTLGAIFLLAGFIANERLIGFLYSPDGVITGSPRARATSWPLGMSYSSARSGASKP